MDSPKIFATSISSHCTRRNIEEVRQGLLLSLKTRCAHLSNTANWRVFSWGRRPRPRCSIFKALFKVSFSTKLGQEKRASRWTCSRIYSLTTPSLLAILARPCSGLLCSACFFRLLCKAFFKLSSLCQTGSLLLTLDRWWENSQLWIKVNNTYKWKQISPPTCFNFGERNEDLLGYEKYID